ncbi:hypothetical protein Ancab_017260 [Ancistrocladus abbreviatus]
MAVGGGLPPPLLSVRGHKLNGPIRVLYEQVDGLMSLPCNQSVLADDRQAKWVDGLLDGSLRLLDVYVAARDELLQIKQRVEAFQSALRRRWSSELSSAEYVSTREKVKKMLQKCLKDVKMEEVTAEKEFLLSFILGPKMQSSRSSWSSVTKLRHQCDREEGTSTSGDTALELIISQDQEKKSRISKNDGSPAIVGMLRDVEEITVEIFGPLLCYISGPKIQSKTNSWFTVSKLMNHNKCRDEAEKAASGSEFEEADDALASLLSLKDKICTVQADQLRTQMTQVESSIQDLDEQLECLFRAMVKTRAALQNILSN